MRNKATPVNGVCRRECVAFFFQLFSQRFVTEDFFYATLRIVKITFNAKNLNVLAHLGNHLAFLDVTYTLARIEYDDFSTFNISKAFKSSLASIAGGSNQNYNLVLFTSLSNSLGQNVGQKLQRHILKGRSRTMPQLQNRSVSINLYQGSRFATKFFWCVCTFNTLTQFVFAKISQELQKNIYRTFSVRLLFHGFDIAQADLGNTFRNKETAVTSQATSNGMGGANEVSLATSTYK